MACEYLWWVCTAHEAENHPHSAVDILEFYKGLIGLRFCIACADFGLDYPAKRLAQLNNVLFRSVWRKIPDVKHLHRKQASVSRTSSPN